MKDRAFSPIRVMRFNLGISQEQVAQEAGVGLQTVVRLENGYTIRPYARVMKALGDFFGKNPVTLTREYLRWRQEVIQ